LPTVSSLRAVDQIANTFDIFVHLRSHEENLHLALIAVPINVENGKFRDRVTHTYKYFYLTCNLLVVFLNERQNISHLEICVETTAIAASQL
jgi:hypothetical protein